MKRLYNLDYLRGIAAFGIMIFHYSSWLFGEFESETVIGRIGIYGVAIFYVLSGLTLFYVYAPKMKPTAEQLLDFARKRFFRIFPLLWLVTLLAVVIARERPDMAKLALNLTGLFGLFKWDQYYATGAWSIGNELVFYLFFPLFIFLTRKSKIALGLASIALFAIYLYFSFIKLNSDATLTDQWKDYVNPLNQVFLFLGGYLIGLVFINVAVPRSLNLVLLALGVGVFIFYPANGDSIHLVTGINRLIFTFSCFVICIAFFKLSFELPPVIHKVFTFLGEASYSVYLIHPFVYFLMHKILGRIIKDIRLHQIGVLIFSIIITLIVSYVVYEKFEKYFMKFGKAKRLRMQNGIQNIADTVKDKKDENNYNKS